MEYVIDAYNLIKSSFLREHEQGGSIDRARDALFNLLLDYKRKHPSVGFTVVFDGFPPSPGIFLKDRKIRIMFSYEATADEVIRQILEKTPDKNRLKTIVSDDRGVQDCGRLLESGVLNVAGFLAVVYPRPRKTGRARHEEEKEINKLKIEKELRAHYKTKS